MDITLRIYIEHIEGLKEDIYRDSFNEYVPNEL